MAAQAESNEGPEERFETSEPPVDAFILFNEREEKSVLPIVDELSSRGISSHFWRRDLKPSDPWEEIEGRRLRSAKAVVVFLGSQGWGPNHLRLAVEAQKARKRIIPVLVGEPPPGASKEAGAIFEKLLYVDLQVLNPAALESLVDALLPGGSTDQFDGIIGVLVDGNEEQRSAILQQVADGRFGDRQRLTNRLRDEIQSRFSPENERLPNPAREPKKMPSIRSWMLSVLIWVGAEYDSNRELILKHLNAQFEAEANVRFWALAGLYQRRVSYLKIAVQSCLSDPAPEVALLAQAIDNPAIAERFSKMLFSDNFEREAWPVLRVLRVLPVPALAKDLCDVVDRSAGGSPLAYDALYALANPPIAAEAAKILPKTRGIEFLLDIIITVARNSDAGSTHRFARLLAAFDAIPMEGALTQAEARHPEAVTLVRTLRRRVRGLRGRAVSPESFVAGYASDAIDVTRDDLDIREDVQTLTAVMLAREVIPPLAIGLFGDWGAGKSFFMHSMKAAAEKISEDARKRGSSKFCTEVVSIEFNAWHYADTNLWASLVSHILESMAKYVSPSETPEQQQAKLIEQLGSAKEVIDQIKGEKETTQTQIAARQMELQQLQTERLQKEVKLRDLRLSDFQSIFKADPALQQEVKTALEDVGVPAVLGSFNDLNRAVAEVQSLRGRATGLAVGLFKAKNGPMLALLVAIVLGLPVLGYWLHQAFQSSFVFLGTVIAEVTTFIGGLAALLSKAASYVKVRLERIELAKQKVDDALAKKRETKSAQEELLEKEIAGLKANEEQVASRLRAATDKVIDLEQRISALTESRSLARFLAERTKSDDYRKHLGVVSMIRQDFETLANQLTNPAPTSSSNLRKVERIVLYVDDLDRCPAEKVVEVLQAVHLLLAYPLFVVVVGVDPRWLAHSLTSVYPVLKEGAAPRDKTEPQGNSNFWRPTPQNYLEKIFQIPFSLRPMTETGYAKLVQGLFSSLGPASVRPKTHTEGARAQTTVPPKAVAEKGDPARTSSPGSTSSPQTDGTAPAGPTAEVTSRESEFTIHEDSLVIRPVEEAFAERLYRLLPTPRATKRFSNTYRILKAPVLPDQLEAFEGVDQAPGAFQVPMLLLAVLIGMPSEAAMFFPLLFDHVTKRQGSEDLAQSEILGFAPEALREKLAEIVADRRFPGSPALFAEWLPRVSRFSFEIGRTIMPASSLRKQT